MTQDEKAHNQPPPAMKSRIEKVPYLSAFIAWLYRLIKLPTRFHELNGLFWKLFARTERIESDLNKTMTAAEELRSHIASVSRDLEMLHAELRRKAGITGEETVKNIASREFSSETYLYCAFENRFRGAPEEIKKDQMQYAEYIGNASRNSKGAYLLDVGCGRGEFLKLMSEKGIEARGIDMTKSMIDECRTLNLKAELSDALNYLRNIKNNLLTGVTAFQVVEHLPPDYLIELIKASFSKIAQGGVIILETVNPGSFSSLKNFYIDLTHKNPIPADTLKFLVETAGFKNAEVRYSAHMPGHFKLQGADENTVKLNELLYGPQNYAVIGWK